jgi:histidinol-phosphate aminotransferase
MQRRLVRVANAVLDLEPYHPSNQKPLFLDPALHPLKLDWNESTIPPAPAAVEAIKEFILNGPLNWYPDVEARELRNKLSSYVSLPVDCISCFGGSDMALEYIARTYLEPGTEAIMSAPTYDNFRVFAQSTGASVTPVYHDDHFDPKVETLINHIGPRTRMIYICNPNNPTGGLLTEAEIVFLLAYAERTMVVVDEAYFEFCSRTVADLVNRFPNLVVVRSFSKAFGLAALRVGYALSNPANLEFINRIKVGKNLNALAQAAAVAALDSLNYVREYIVGVNQSKKILTQNLAQIGYRFRLTPANFFLLEVSEARQAIELLEEEGIFVRDQSRVPGLEGYVRVTIGTPDQTDRLLLTLSRLADKLATGANRSAMVETVNRVTERIRKAVTVR